MIPAIRAFTEKQHVVLSVLLSTKPLTLENTKGAIKKGQSRENGSITTCCFSVKALIAGIIL
jgi:hypothetical protein